MKKLGTVLIVFVLAVLFGLNWPWSSQAAVASNIITVTTSGDNVADDGQCSLREALHNANNNTQLFASNGECNAGSATQTDVIVLQSGMNYALVIDGSGDDEGDLDIRPNGLPLDLRIETDGEGPAIIQMVLGTHRVMEIHGATVEIENINFMGGFHADFGGGIYNNEGTLTLIKARIEAASANAGGGLYNRNGTVLLDETTVTGNFGQLGGSGIVNTGVMTITNHSQIGPNTLTPGSGGGIYNDGGSLTLIDSTVRDNPATLYGGGIYSQGSDATLTIQNSRIQNNVAQTGGGIYLLDHEAVVTDAVIYQNSAINGGGIHNSGDLTIIDGEIHANEATGPSGGAIHSYGRLTIEGTQIYNNNAVHLGGAIALLDSTEDVTISGVTISDNGAGHGGGLYNGSSFMVNAVNEAQTPVITIQDSLITLNQATHNTQGRGGGIYHSLGELVVINSQITRNYAYGSGDIYGGGGIFNGASSDLSVMANTVVAGNRALQGGGGGILNLGAAVIENAVIDDNQGASGGGIATYQDSQLIVRNSLIIGNESQTGWGGGIDASSPTTIVNSTITGNRKGGGIRFFLFQVVCADSPALRVLNATISDNDSVRGGGILVTHGTAEILHTTITKNNATSAGNGVYATNLASTCVSIGHSIISGNDNPDVLDDIAAETTDQRYISLGHNLIGRAGENVDFTLDFTEEGDRTNILDPGLAALADNGGPTLTHALLPDSLAIGLGDPAVCAAASGANGVDQRGFLRDSVTCDSGAYEYGLTLTVVLDGDGQGDVTSDPSGIDCQKVNCAFRFPHDTAVELTATPAEDQFFVHWTGAVSGSNPTIVVTMDATKSVTAVFSASEPAYQLYLPVVIRP